jgi:hypothetical protein
MVVVFVLMCFAMIVLGFTLTTSDVGDLEKGLY